MVRPVPTSSLAASSAFVVLDGPGGLPVHLLRTRKFKTVALSWALECPLDERRAARALLGDLLTRGTASHPGLADLSARCDELYATDLGGSVGAHGPLQLVKFSMVTLADRYAEGLDLFRQASELLSEAVHEPPLQEGRFRRDHLEQERANLVRAIEGLADDKGHWALRRMIETLHADTPYGLHSWGTAEEAAALDEAAVHSTWDDLLTSAPGRLFVVGDVEEEQALEAAERLGRSVPRPEPAQRLPLPEQIARAPLRVTEAEDLSQSKLVLGFRLPESAVRSPAATTFATVFGGGSHSRLFKRVREAESLAYGCGARMLHDSGTLVVQAGIDASSAARVEELVVEELARLAIEPVSDDELQLSKRAQSRRLRSLVDHPRALGGFRLAQLLAGRPHELPDAIAAAEAVTAADVMEIAAAVRLDAVYLLEGTAT